MSHPSPTFRPYRPADRASCVAILESNIPQYFKDGDQTDFLGYLDKLPGPYFVLESEEQGIVGCGGYAMDDQEAHLCWGMVRQDLHKQGLGRLLFERRIQHIAATAAVARIRLNTTQHTAGFYEKFGFRTLRTVPDGYGPGLDRVEMQKDVQGER
jgi:GNAT superfamily N-acetyltransferase